MSKNSSISSVLEPSASNLTKMLVSRPLQLDAPHFVVRFVEVVGPHGVLVATQPPVDVRRVEVAAHGGVLEPVDHVGDGVAEVLW